MKVLRIAWFALALGLPVVLVAGCSSEEERFQAHLAEAERFAEAGSTREALIELRSALKLRPQNALVNERIARLMERRGAYEEAVFFYREAQRLDPQAVEPLLGEIPLVMGVDGERARQLVDRALVRAPADPRVQRRRSEVALLFGETEEALAAVYTGLELAPDDRELHIQLALVNRARIRDLRSRNEEPPEELYRAALEAAQAADAGEGSVLARVEQAHVYASWPGHLDEAVQAYRSAAELAAAQGNPGLQYVVLQEAVDWARRSGQLELRRWALAQLLAVDPETLEAAATVQDTDFRPHLLSAWAELAQLEQQLDGSGEQVLATLLERRPDDADVHQLNARLLASQGQIDAALEALSAAAERGVDPPQLLDAAVRLALRSAQIDAARSTLEVLKRQYPEAAPTLLAEARLALARGRSADAAELLRRVNDVGESAESHRLLAFAEMQSGDSATAIQEIDRALELAPGDVEALRMKARLHHQLGDWTAVVQTTRRLRRAGAALTQTDRLVLVRPLYELDQPESGRALLEELLAQEDPPLGVAVAFARNEGRRDPERALEVLEQARARAPQDPRLLALATALDLAAGRNERALARIDRALRTGPATPALRMLRARTLVQAGRLEEAEQAALGAFEENPDFPGVLPLVLSIYQTQGRTDEAIRQLEETDQSGLLTNSNRALLARLHLSGGNLDRARVLYEEALRQDASLAGAKNDLAFLLARQGEDLDRALALAKQAQETLGLHPDVVDTLGFVFLRKGLAAPAVEQFRYAISLAEEVGEAPAVLHYHLGLALRALGREQAAVVELEKALAVDPEFPDAEDARRELEAARASASTPAS